MDAEEREFLYLFRCLHRLVVNGFQPINAHSILFVLKKKYGITITISRLFCCFGNIQSNLIYKRRGG